MEIPGGRLTAGRSEEGLRTLGRIESVEAFEDLIVADSKGSPVRVRDVAVVLDGEEEPRTLSRLNGENAVSLLIRKQSGTNTVAVVDAVKARLAEVQKGLPQDIKFEIVRDLSRFIKRSFHEVQDHLLLGGLLASLIVAAFIGRLLWWESAVLVAIVAAVSVTFVSGNPELLIKVTGAATVVTMIFFLSVKKLRPAFVAARGHPVLDHRDVHRDAHGGLHPQQPDDARAVAVDGHRHRRRDHRAGEHLPAHGGGAAAAVRGGHRGHEGDLARRDRDHALARGDLPARGVHGRARRQVLELLRPHRHVRHPRLAARRLHAHADARRADPARAARSASTAEIASPRPRPAGSITGSSAATRRALGWCLRHRVVCLAATALIFVGGFYLLKSTPLEFVVDDDMSEFEVVAEAPPGSSIERSAEIVRAMETEIRTIPEVTTLFTTVGVRGQYQSNVTDMSIYVGLRPLAERSARSRR